MRTNTLILVILAVLWGMIGCGNGSNDGSSTGAAAARSGHAVFTVQWPVRGRLVPTAANSIRVEISNAGTSVTSQLLVRPTSGGASTATFAALPPGNLTALANSYASSDGSGTALSQAESPLVVRANQTSNLTLTMTSTIDHLELQPASLSLTVTQTQQLVVTAKDSSGNVVLMSASKIQWSSDAGTIATVDNSGNVTAAAVGTVHITVKDTESGKNAIATVTVTAFIPPPPNVNPWPMSGHDAQNTGQGIGSGAVGSLKWMRSGLLPFTLVLGKVGTMYGIDNYTVYAINSATGQTKWQVPRTLNGSVPSLALGTNGTLYVCADSLTALDAASGSTLWSVTGQQANGNLVLDSNNVVYIGTSSSFSAFDGNTGSRKWQTNIVSGGLALGTDGTLYMCSSIANKLYAFDSLTGIEKWEPQYTNSLTGVPVVGSNGMVYFGDNVKVLHAVDTTSHIEKWSYTSGTLGGNPYPVIATDGTVYGMFDSLVALDGLSGTVKWKVKLDTAAPDALCIGSDGTIYAHNGGPKFYALDKLTGAQKWVYQSSTNFSRSPIIGSDGVLYIPANSALLALQ